MAYRDLRDFLRKLEKEGELKRFRRRSIRSWRSPKSRTARSKPAGRRFLFERPKGSRVPVVTNLVGTESAA